MKKTFVIILITLPFFAFGNMANPIQSGTINGSPFVNQFVDVIHENITVTIDSNFQQAKFNIRYEIESSANGLDIPFLFYASDYHHDFAVFVDGQRIELKALPDNIVKLDESKFKDFNHMFGSEENQLELPEELKYKYEFGINDLQYFETDISKGKHVIEVNYVAKRWKNSKGLIKKYDFRYVLAPARFWKSYGTLDIVINAQNFSLPVKTNLPGKIQDIILDSMHYSFDALPIDVLEIQFHPKVSKSAKVLQSIGPIGFALLNGIVLFICHLILFIRSKKKKPVAKYNWVKIIGFLVVPLLITFSLINYYGLLKDLVGPHASNMYGGYYVLNIVLYPIILIGYVLLFWLVTKIINRVK